jgi:hypothetical protein
MLPLKRMLIVLCLSAMSAAWPIPTDNAYSQGTEFNREECLKGCGYRYGGYLGFSNRDPRPILHGTHEECMMECERRFWKEFDRETKEAESKGGGSEF